MGLRSKTTFKAKPRLNLVAEDSRLSYIRDYQMLWCSFELLFLLVFVVLYSNVFLLSKIHGRFMKSIKVGSKSNVDFKHLLFTCIDSIGYLFNISIHILLPVFVLSVLNYIIQLLLDNSFGMSYAIFSLEWVQILSVGNISTRSPSKQTPEEIFFHEWL
jgi:hypothetical protein